MTTVAPAEPSFALAPMTSSLVNQNKSGEITHRLPTRGCAMGNREFLEEAVRLAIESVEQG
jgi:hypothetical protein